MTYDPDHDWIVNEPVSGSSDGDDVTIMIPEYDFPEPPSVPSASSEKGDSTMPRHTDCNTTDSTTINGNDDIMVPEYDSSLPTFVPSNSSERDESTMTDYNNNNNDVREATTIPDVSDCTNDSSTDRKGNLCLL